MRDLILCLAALSVACGGNTGPSVSDASTDSASSGDAGPDGWHGCTASADTACQQATNPSCPTIFDGGCFASDISVGTCGNYVVWTSHGTDSGKTYYYDKSSGALVAVVNYLVPAAEFCVGGPSDFTPPSSCTQNVCGDGG